MKDSTIAEGAGAAAMREDGGASRFHDRSARTTTTRDPTGEMAAPDGKFRNKRNNQYLNGSSNNMDASAASRTSRRSDPTTATRDPPATPTKKSGHEGVSVRRSKQLPNEPTTPPRRKKQISEEPSTTETTMDESLSPVIVSPRKLKNNSAKQAATASPKGASSRDGGESLKAKKTKKHPSLSSPAASPTPEASPPRKKKTSKMDGSMQSVKRSPPGHARALKTPPPPPPPPLAPPQEPASLEVRGHTAMDDKLQNSKSHSVLEVPLNHPHGATTTKKKRKQSKTPQQPPGAYSVTAARADDDGEEQTNRGGREPASILEVRNHAQDELQYESKSELLVQESSRRLPKKHQRKSSRTPQQQQPGAYSLTPSVAADEEQASNPPAAAHDQEALALSAGTGVARSRQNRKDHKMAVTSALNNGAEQSYMMERVDTRIVRPSVMDQARLQDSAPVIHHNSKDLGASDWNEPSMEEIEHVVAGEHAYKRRSGKTSDAGSVDHRELLQTPREPTIRVSANQRRPNSPLPRNSEEPATGDSNNLISARLVSDFDDDFGGATRESVYRQAQEDGARQAREDLLRDVLVAEEVVDEAAIKRRRKRQGVAFGVCFVVVVVLVAVLAAQPWKSDPIVGIPPPSNDLCTGAIALSSDDVEIEGSTVGASPVNFPTCVSSVQSGGLGVWFTVDGTGRPIRVSTCDSNTTEAYDTQITLFQGTCEDHVCVGGNDNASPDENCGIFSSLTFPSELGKNYILCVHGKFAATDGAGETKDGIVEDATPVSGTFQLTVDEPVENDFCEGAFPLEPNGESLRGSTVDATSDTQVSFCGGTESTAPGVWYVVRGTGRPIQALATPATNTNFQLTVYEGNLATRGNQREDCRRLTCIAGRDNPFQFDSQVTFPTSEDTMYYILVHGVDRQRGEFDLRVEETAQNDLCESAISIDDDPETTTTEPLQGGLIQMIRGSTELATFSGRAQSGASCGGLTPTGAGVWYYVEGKDGDMTAHTCMLEDDSSGGTLDTTLSVFEASADSVLADRSCRNLVCVGSNDDSCGRQSSVTWRATQQARYYILVSGKTAEKGSFELSIEY